MKKDDCTIWIANSSELEDIFMMGFDAWFEGSSRKDYLENCFQSPKYSDGIWYVLSCSSRLVTSLLVHDFKSGRFGIGSIATNKSYRKQGYASILILDVMKILRESYNAKIIFLYSDIGSTFYEKFKFAALPKNFQKHKGSCCMVWPSCRVEEIKKSKIPVPTYF